MKNSVAVAVVVVENFFVFWVFGLNKLIGLMYLLYYVIYWCNILYVNERIEVYIRRRREGV